jgi:MHS family alpha-ketoglutarate permease-like MFS transporter
MKITDITSLPEAHHRSEHEAIQETSFAARKQSLKAAAIGNILEWYDWTVYSTFSVYLADSFFSKSDPTSAFLSTLAIFAGGFLARPIGGYIFGRMADNKGRRLALIVTMIMLAATSLGIALMPDYSEIGSWASLGLFVMRLLQGFAHGGESGVSYVYIAEIAPRERRAFWASSVYVSVIIGVMLATGVAALLTALLSIEDMGEWGWRIGFGLGAILGLYALYMRRNAVETDTYVKLHDKDARGVAQEKPSRMQYLRFSLLIIALNAAINVWYYIWVAFAPAMAISVYGMSPKGAYTSSLIAQAIALIFIPIFGYMSDRIGRRRTYIIFAILIGVMAVPIQNLLSDQPWTLLLAQGLGLIIWSIGIGQYPALMAELVPTRVRGMGVGILSSLVTGLFGGTAPYLHTWMHSIGVGWMFQAYIIGLALITVLVAYNMRETAGIDLNR